jgi:hypothetical protein
MHIPLKEKTTAVDTRKTARKLEGKVSLLLFIRQGIRGACSQVTNETDYHSNRWARLRFGEGKSTASLFRPPNNRKGEVVISTRTKLVNYFLPRTKVTR